MSDPGVVVSDKAPALIGPYSLARIHGGCAFASGQLPLDPRTGRLVSEDIVEQLEQCLKNIEAIAEAAGATRRHILKVTLMVTEFDRMPELNAAYGAFFQEPYPARATMQLAGLPMAAKVEIDAVIAVTGDRTGRQP